jgi:hypothetical protein
MMGDVLAILPGTGRGTSRRLVEGLALRQNAGKRPLHIVQDVARGQTQRTIALRNQPFVPRLVAERDAAAVVRFSVDFNRKACGKADEVENERSGGMLATPFMPRRSRPELPPEQHFRQRHLPPQLARGADRCTGTPKHRASPSTVLRTVPLPVPGRIFARRGLSGNRVAALLFALLVLFSAAPAAADTRSERREVLAAAQALFDALAARDPAAVVAVVVAEGTISGHVTRDGTTRFFAERWQDWANGLREGTERLEERMHDPRVRIRGNMASVWTYYTFYRDGRFSHCGIDLFDMAKVDGSWRVLNITFTVETEGCRRR